MHEKKQNCVGFLFPTKICNFFYGVEKILWILKFDILRVPPIQILPKKGFAKQISP
jgi:hypothetical protein